MAAPVPRIIKFLICIDIIIVIILAFVTTVVADNINYELVNDPYYPIHYDRSPPIIKINDIELWDYIDAWLFFIAFFINITLLIYFMDCNDSN